MDTSIIESKNSIDTIGTYNNEYTNSLILENEQLKMLNDKLYRRTLNQKRKILRLKKMMKSEQPITSYIDDMTWEDVNDVLNELKEESTNDNSNLEKSIMSNENNSTENH